MSKQKLRTVRLRKQQISLEKEPIENAFVRRIDDLKFYYCLYNLEDDFKNGFYFGLLDLHHEYPFAAPKLFMYTPNGRYEENMAICTSFTNYHQESWTSAWNVRSLIQATISFMYANEPSYGCRHDNSQVRKKYANDSVKWNMNNELFVKLFGSKLKQELPRLKKMGIKIDENLLEKLESKDSIVSFEPQRQKSQTNEIALNNNLIYEPLLDQNKLLKNNQVFGVFNENPEKQKRRKENRRKIIIGVLIGGGISGIVIGFIVNYILKK